MAISISYTGFLPYAQILHWMVEFSPKCTKKRLIERVYEPYFCDPPGARTQDPNIKSVVLYQLS